jgi:hypothetical protein
MYKFSGFSMGLEAAYLLDFAGNLTNTESKDDLSDPYDQNRILTSDWTGWYVGIKTQIWLNF